MNTISTYTLENGLRIIHCPSPTDVVYCGYAINAGTRDEKDNEQGIAHFVEHLLFKGTTHRRAWHILNRMENVGGDLNAYTNKEETVVYSAFLKQHFMRAAELLTDIVFHSTFPENQIEKEVEVIIDEIQSYEDSPAELIFDDFEELIFPDHALGRNILGKPELLRGFGTEDALRFTRSRYKTGNMVFFVLGNIPFRKVTDTIEKLTRDITTHTLPVGERTSPLAYVPRNLTLHRDTHQSHVMIGTRAYDAHNSRRTGLYLLNNILGGPGMNSRLNVALREKNALVYNVESNLTSYTDTGVFSIYFGCDQEDRDRCIELTRKELKKLRDNLMKDSQLSAAKKQIIGQLGVASDNFENCALDMGKCFLHYNRYEEKEEVYKRIESITSNELLEIANEIFSEEQLSTLIYE
ncbi:pitrilysin family protein [uncultured Bacteroides sp.]|uniref:M16 family metallopeptidase n=1 Tax=uncultured Bacteroides sp. TaxID=162156 RepID=UPI00262D5860|nr:pitrilysin family protein [uncultured Bacteroides sp.]